MTMPGARERRNDTLAVFETATYIAMALSALEVVDTDSMICDKDRETYETARQALEELGDKYTDLFDTMVLRIVAKSCIYD